MPSSLLACAFLAHVYVGHFSGDNARAIVMARRQKWERQHPIKKMGVLMDPDTIGAVVPTQSARLKAENAYVANA